jgi:hypothetical protein
MQLEGLPGDKELNTETIDVVHNGKPYELVYKAFKSDGSIWEIVKVSDSSGREVDFDALSDEEHEFFWDSAEKDSEEKQESEQDYDDYDYDPYDREPTDWQRADAAARAEDDMIARWDSRYESAENDKPMVDGNKPKFKKTYCSQCGGEFGPGNSGYSSCKEHSPKKEKKPKQK